MKVPADVRCLECSQIFCCADCRREHEALAHGVKYDCPICRKKPLPLGEHKPTAAELLDHVCKKHLPLSCRTCLKRFESAGHMEKPGCCEGPKKESETDASMAPLRNKHMDCLAAEIKSEVMTSTPTHPTTPHWGIFHKSFASTLSGIGSPDSDAVQSPPPEDHKDILVDTHTPNMSLVAEVTDRVLKSNISKSDRDTTQDLSSKRKRVTFADEVRTPDNPQARSDRRFVFEFTKPMRPPTPAKPRPMRTRTPRFQAIMNNFESRCPKQFSTPEQPSKRPTLSDETPQTIDPAIAARTIDFKQNDSPFSAETLVKKSTSFCNSSPTTEKCDVTNIDMYKSCIMSDEASKPEETEHQPLQDLPQKIAQSIQDTLDVALRSHECSSEIHLKIVITKEVVSIKETKRPLPSLHTIHKQSEMHNESTTIWSRFVNNLKWVWRNRYIGSDTAPSEENRVDAILKSANKRKRYLSQLGGESPQSHKKPRHMGRICGRRPLDRMLRGGLVLRSNSDLRELRTLSRGTQKDVSQSLNKSF